jgi:hypothetical protein
MGQHGGVRVFTASVYAPFCGVVNLASVALARVNE